MFTVCAQKSCSFKEENTYCKINFVCNPPERKQSHNKIKKLPFL